MQKIILLYLFNWENLFFPPHPFFCPKFFPLRCTASACASLINFSSANPLRSCTHVLQTYKNVQQVENLVEVKNRFFLVFISRHYNKNTLYPFWRLKCANCSLSVPRIGSYSYIVWKVYFLLLSNCWQSCFDFVRKEYFKSIETLIYCLLETWFQSGVFFSSQVPLLWFSYVADRNSINFRLRGLYKLVNLPVFELRSLLFPSILQ